MSVKTSVVIGAGVFAVIAAGVLLAPKPRIDWPFDTPTSGPTDGPTPKPTDTGVIVRSMFDFQKQLAAQVKTELAGDTDVLIVPTTYEVPVGSLIQIGRQLADDDSDCVPATPPHGYNVPSMFSSYKLTSDAAASYDVGNDVTAAIGQAGASIDRGQTISLSFDKVQLAFLGGPALNTMLQNVACQKAISQGGPYLIVRGYFSGTRQFRIAATGASKVTVGTRLGKLQVVRSPGDTSVELVDPAPAGFLQLLSQVTVTPAASPASGGAPGPTAPSPLPNASAAAVGLPQGAKVVLLPRHNWQAGPKPASSPATVSVVLSKPSVITAARVGAGQVYVQRDANDASGNDARIVVALAAAGLPVVKKVEAIGGGKVPNAAQVRYFNAGDLARAQTALTVLRKTYATATLVQVPLPAPVGQLEVWLPKA